MTDSGVVRWLVGGLAATVVLSVTLATNRVFGLTRMSLPVLLGTMVSSDRDRARAWGVALHLINGWLFGLIYLAGFGAAGSSAWWFGGLIGLFHGTFVLTAGLPALPGLHPRMASEAEGPTVVRRLEPPGPGGINYGAATPASLLAAHIAFGVTLALFWGAT